MGTQRSSNQNSVSVLPLVLTGLLLMLAIHHIFQWDIYGVEIVHLKARERLAKLTPQDLSRIVFICQTRAQAGCLEKYQRMKAEKLQSPTPYFELANYFSIKRPDKSLFYFAEYFKNKGNDPQAAFDFGQLLEKSGRHADALKYFDYAVHKSKKTQPRLIRSYVTALIRNNQWLEAKMWIERVRRMSQESVYFMETEMRSIERKITSRDSTIKTG